MWLAVSCSQEAPMRELGPRRATHMSRFNLPHAALPICYSHSIVTPSFHPTCIIQSQSRRCQDRPAVSCQLSAAPTRKRVVASPVLPSFPTTSPAGRYIVAARTRRLAAQYPAHAPPTPRRRSKPEDDDIDGLSLPLSMHLLIPQERRADACEAKRPHRGKLEASIGLTRCSSDVKSRYLHVHPPRASQSLRDVTTDNDTSEIRS